MKIKDFGVEQWMNKYETHAVYNLGETCVSSISLNDLCELSGTEPAAFADRLMSRRLTYGAIEGSADLKELIAQLYKDVTPADIITEHGAIGANHLVLTTLMEPGDEIIVVTPTYQQMHSIPEAIQAKIKYLPLILGNHYHPDMDQLKALLSPKTKLIIINNPNNPTGALMTEEELKSIAALASSCGAYVLCDEVYRFLTQKDMYSPSIVDLYDKGIATGSFSKVFSLAGIRLGWAVTRDKALMRQMLSHRDYKTISCGALDEMIGILALSHKDKILQRNRAIVRCNLSILENWVNEEPLIAWHKPQAGTTALLHYDLLVKSETFCDLLMKEEKTLLVPGACFGVENSLRIGYAFEKDMLLKGLERVSAFMEKLKNGTISAE
jgi:aspartate/methionine/tyrosine aminotransferase